MKSRRSENAESESAAKIEVEAVAEGQFRVRVADGKCETSHQVTLGSEYYQRIAAGRVSPRELVKRSFEFLLEHEAKESILAEFDLSTISRYFPEYEREIQRRPHPSA
jgi:hypothetical protein